MLSSTLSIAQKLAEYWTDGILNDSPDNERWVAERPFPPPETKHYHRYTGPGPLFVCVNPSTVRVRTGGRWRGFVGIQPLRTIHIEALTAIATAFRTKEFRCFPDNDFVDDVFCDGVNFEDCVTVLDEHLGRPVMLKEEIDAHLAAETDSGCPLLQYVSAISMGGEPGDARESPS
ncbi:hypothetical protein LOC67_24665 [Stieleria sp. JC731]|uniref:hypothetical protein n=1 Tax=Pirellulaceae TaxID=2691357 RepID=UPI001E38AD3E|nr:hypothetical protein [Stieleria sp. JC731]MCC9603756.1 hypothetical protein [Stieleria sp. JC731]